MEAIASPTIIEEQFEHEPQVEFVREVVLFFAQEGWMRKNYHKRRPWWDHAQDMQVNGETFEGHQGMLPRPIKKLMAARQINSGAELRLVLELYQSKLPSDHELHDLSFKYLDEMSARAFNIWVYGSGRNDGMVDRWMGSNDNYAKQATLLLNQAGVSAGLEGVGNLTEAQKDALNVMRGQMEHIADIWDAQGLIDFLSGPVLQQPKIFHSLVRAHYDWRKDEYGDDLEDKVEYGLETGDLSAVDLIIPGELSDLVIKDVKNSILVNFSDKKDGSYDLNMKIEEFRDLMHTEAQDGQLKYTAHESFLAMVEILKTIQEFKVETEKSLTDSQRERLNSAMGNLIYNIKADLNTDVIDGIFAADVAIKQGQVKDVDFLDENNMPVDIDFANAAKGVISEHRNNLETERVARVEAAKTESPRMYYSNADQTVVESTLGHITKLVPNNYWEVRRVLEQRLQPKAGVSKLKPAEIGLMRDIAARLQNDGMHEKARAINDFLS